MTGGQRKLTELLLILFALWLQRVLRRRYAKTETHAPQPQRRMSDLLSPRDWNGFLRAVMFMSVCVGVPVWFILLVGLTTEAGLWIVKQTLGYVPQSQPFWFLFAIFSIPLAWAVFASVSRRLLLGRRLDGLLETPSTAAAAAMTLIAGSGVALIVYAQHHHLLLLS